MCTQPANSTGKQADVRVAENLPGRPAQQPETHAPVSRPRAQGNARSYREEPAPPAPENVTDGVRDQFHASPSSVPEPPDAGSSRLGNLDNLGRFESQAKVTPISKFKKRDPAESAEQGSSNEPAGASARGSENAATTPRPKPAAGSDEQTAAARLLKFFGLRQQPFDVTPDPAFLYSSPSHREALDSLRQGIEHFRGFMMLIAEPGMGKTMLLNKLMEELGDTARVVFLFQTQYNSSQLLSFILDELEVDHTGMDAVAMHRVLNHALLEEMLRGQRFVLIVDEAQNLQPPVLETIRLLSDFETTHSKLIQIVLAGQPQLADTLVNPALGQLRQRIGMVSHLQRLTPKEISEYIDHRMRAAGWTGNLPFTRDAQTQIAEYSKGVPRTINNLCFNALLQAFHCDEQIVDATMVRTAIQKMNLELPVQPSQSSSAPGRLTAQPRAAVGSASRSQWPSRSGPAGSMEPKTQRIN
jgi:general secretion pathway protein A